MILAWMPQKSRAQSRVTKEYEVKAAFLFHFTQFVDWPPDDFTNKSEPFRIGILGDNPFGHALDEIVKGEAVNGRELSVQYSKHVEDLKRCQIIFISKSEESHLSRILAGVDDGVLTVGDFNGFARNGGIINFYLEDGKVRFEINPGAAEREQVKISSQLLRLGKIVKTES